MLIYTHGHGFRVRRLFYALRYVLAHASEILFYASEPSEEVNAASRHTFDGGEGLPYPHSLQLLPGKKKTHDLRP
jgi:hypothetical protein